MKITAARGAIAITLDRPRILFFDMDATWILVGRYGAGFVRDLYTLEGKGLSRCVKLKSPDALRFFLWAGLQAEISDLDETLDEDQARALIHPWTFEPIFNALVMAITGAVSTPAAPGKNQAEGKPASPPVAASHKASTSRRRRGLRAAG